MSSEHEEEDVSLTIPEVFVYKIPPATSAAGHKAADWSKDHVWAGKLQVVARGKASAVKLVATDGKVFAVAPVRKDGPAAAEKVTDSSRYFVLRIENDKGAYAFIGVGFNQRSDAFDFNVALQDAIKDMDESKAATLLGIGELGTDFSLKQGEKITIKVNIDGAKKGAGASASGAGGGLKLRAPPAAGGSSSGTVAGDAGLAASLDGLSLGRAPAPAPAPAPATSTWESFS